ncbi:energy transducer TonB [Methylobacterium sp. J-048]|uniref:energy transducer TonB family protein n=1 Tax=Methylobacterium sp. J-048 TaxID=2836635 RepID=UPI001FBBEF4E|nr:energy transducer TonB [Methylobacterium sp. J-048]MCJ2058464.1 energy transducer TonB [Methylobacterium sp. J-048]
MSSRLLTHGIVVLGLLLVPWSAQARTGVSPAVRTWLSALVTRIDAVDRTERRGTTRGAAGTVVVRVEIAADGSVRQAEIERSSGSRGLDQRALRAVQGASPFKAPPAELLAETGMADLSVPVQFGP